MMPTEIERLEDQLRRSFEGGAWHGPSVAEVLADVSTEGAYDHPVAGAHSIWELVLHVIGTYKLVLRRLKGDAAPLTPSEDWPPIPQPTTSNWEETIRSLRRLNEQLRQAVLQLSPEQLTQPLVAESPSTAYTQLIGITQHDLYHAGQIVVLKKALTSLDSRSD